MYLCFSSGPCRNIVCIDECIVCIRIHAYLHTYIHAYIHADIHTYIQTCMHAYIHHTCIHTYIYTASQMDGWIDEWQKGGNIKTMDNTDNAMLDSKRCPQNHIGTGLGNQTRLAS